MPEIRFTSDGRQIYEPDGSVLVDFLLCRKPVIGIQGPVGSGKSKGANMLVYAIASEQRPDRYGIRRTRWAVVRNTYPELKNTTIRTWLDTFPEEVYGKFRWSIPYQHIIRLDDMVIEVDFLALDKPDDVKKLRSGEYTGFYFNEMQYIPKDLFDEATSRAGRYPAVKDGGCTWSGVVFDMNAPEEDHWTGMMTGQVPYPDGMPEEEREALRWPVEWGFFMQPPGLIAIRDADGSIIGYENNPIAENVKWLKPNYYLDQIKGKTRSWIDSRIMNVVTVILEGSPVWPTFRPEIHFVNRILQPLRSHDLHVGLDFGRQPAAIIGQSINGRVIVYDELIGRDESATVFAPKVKALLERKYPGFRVRFHGDPKGQDKTQTDERTAYDIFRQHGMNIEPAPVPTNNIKTRLEAVEFCLTQLVDGKPKFLVTANARTIKMAMQGKYHYRKNDFNKLEPVKDQWSNPADALQYMILGMGEGKAMVGLDAAHRPTPYVPSRAAGGQAARFSRGARRRGVGKLRQTDVLSRRLPPRQLSSRKVASHA